MKTSCNNKIKVFLTTLKSFLGLAQLFKISLIFISRMLKMLPIVVLAMVAGQAMSTVEQWFKVSPQKKMIDCPVLEKKLCQDSDKRKPCQKGEKPACCNYYQPYIAVNLKLVTHGFMSNYKSVEGIKDGKYQHMYSSFIL